MKEIPLTQNKIALVDDADFDELNKHKWYAACIQGEWYAARNVTMVSGKQRQLLMHCAILPAGGKLRDHKDGNGLNNQRSNLRFCTRSQNAQNAKMPTFCKSSRFKGVSWHKQMKQWRSQIKVYGQAMELGFFKVESDAAKAYDAAARLYFGEFARTNFKEA